eukprot:TRINITY_DN13301_c0_g2_i2.p1 TRINITY_DN13301_c0_g2~~TRINITY_DN13301_c0_g2_i2.p1  ORF type:complete len:150 (-),score=21.56 TRINITY_DN13301_c0_g2_i2:63-512(-)
MIPDLPLLSAYRKILNTINAAVIHNDTAITAAFIVFKIFRYAERRGRSGIISRFLESGGSAVCLVTIADYRRIDISAFRHPLLLPSRIACLRCLWKSHPDANNEREFVMKQSANDALDLMFDMDESLHWLRETAKRTVKRAPTQEKLLK